jgi:hypothetical protein
VQGVLLQNYKLFVCPVLEFDCPIWQPIIKKTNVQKLQRVQNVGLRIVTCSQKRASIDYLHAETQMLRVDQHILISTQFLANIFQRDHPFHVVMTLPPDRRSMKETLYSKNIETVRPHLHDGVILAGNYKRVIKHLHTSAVSKALCASSLNKVLGLYPPSVSAEEETLTRCHCCTLNQLHSGECHRLHSYQFSIRKAKDDLCPECCTASYATSNLFECTFFPNNLKKWDIWYHPREAAIFISNLPLFIHHLPPVAPLLLPILPSHLLPDLFYRTDSNDYTTNQRRRQRVFYQRQSNFFEGMFKNC